MCQRGHWQVSGLMSGPKSAPQRLPGYAFGSTFGAIPVSILETFRSQIWDHSVLHFGTISGAKIDPLRAGGPPVGLTRAAF